MNNAGTLHLWDKDFSPQQAENCELLIRVSNKRLSYALVEKPSFIVKAVFDSVLSLSPAETFADLAQKYNYLEYPYREIRVAAETFRFTFLPTSLYSQETGALFGNFSASSIPSVPVNHTIAGNRISTVATIGSDLSAPFTEKYPSAKLYTQAEALIEGSLNGQAEGRTLSIQFNTGTFEILLTEAGELLFYNIYQAPTADDFNYFLLLVIQQMEIDTSQVRAELSGEIEKFSEYYRRVLKYFNTIHFADSNRFCRYPDHFRVIPPHQFYALLSLGLCG